MSYELLLLLLLFPYFTQPYTLIETKCREYGKAVYRDEVSPTLLRRSKSNRVSTCAIESIPLIIGGKKCKPKEFPHMVVIGFGLSPTDTLAWECGGSLISDLFVLTAAHCLESREKGPAQKAKLGTIDLFEPADQIQERNIVERIGHPAYNSRTKENDIALLKMSGNVQFTPYIRPACLNTKSIPTQTQLIATGFGKLSYDANKGSKDLMKVQLTLYDRNTCQSTVKDQIKPSMLCVGEMSGGKDTCQGDSGGPLQMILNDPYCMYAIVGVTSFGRFCGFPNSPAIYTDVRQYLDWIAPIVWN